jgi:hypothetical protein
VTIDA